MKTTENTDSTLKRIYVSEGGRFELIALYLRTDKTGRYRYEYSILSRTQGMLMPSYNSYKTEKEAITRAIISIKPEIKRILGDSNKLTKDFMEWAAQQNTTCAKTAQVRSDVNETIHKKV